MTNHAYLLAADEFSGAISGLMHCENRAMNLKLIMLENLSSWIASCTILVLNTHYFYAIIGTE
jgi:hypothetical protein